MRDIRTACKVCKARKTNKGQQVNEDKERELYDLEEMLANLNMRVEQNKKVIEEIKQSIEKLKAQINR